MANKSVYQSEEYKRAIQKKDKIIDISENYYAIERKISHPLGKKTILEGWGTPSREDLKLFKEISKKYFYGTIHPTVLDKNYSDFSKIGYKKASNHTILLNLNQTEEDLWKNLEKKSARWGVKTAENNGLKFENAKKEDLERFYEIYKKTAEQGGFKHEDKEFIYTMLDTNVSKLFIIKKNNVIIAGGLVLIDKGNNYSILDLTAATEQGLELQAMPFLYWNLILYSKKMNMTYFDLGGYDKEARENDKTYKINKFKERFGGEIAEQLIYSTNNIYPIIRKAIKNIKAIKKFYKKS